MNEDKTETTVSNPIKPVVSDELNSMVIVPWGVEILAYHEAGGNFHPVKFDQEGHATMRWHAEYSQYKAHFLGWIHYPKYSR